MRLDMVTGVVLSLAMAGTTAAGSTQITVKKTGPAGDEVLRPMTLTGCPMIAGGAETAGVPASGGASGTGPDQLNKAAANSAATFTVNLGGRNVGPGVDLTDTASAERYELLDRKDMRQYVNKHVEITGTLEPEQTAAAGGAAVTGTAGTTTTGAVSTSPGETAGERIVGQSPLRRFHVTSIRVVPGSCPGLR